MLKIRQILEEMEQEENDAKCVEVVDEPSSLTYSDTAAVEMSVYKASSQSRRTNWVLLIGAVSIWVFAAWTIVTIIPDGIELGEVVSLVLMAGLLW